MGHALNNTMQDTLIRLNRMRGRRAKWILGTDHAGIATQTQVEKALRAEGTSREELGREAFVERTWEWTRLYGGTIVGQLKRLGCSLDYANERFTLDDDYVGRGDEGLRRPLRQGPDLPRQLHGQLGPGLAERDLRPGGRGARGHRHPLLRRLPAGVGARLADDRHRAAGDDARRHRDRRAPGRRPLHAPGGGDGDPADRRAPAEDHRRPVREARVRHRRAEDHARPRPQRLRDRPQPRAGGDLRDRRGRPHDRGGRRAVRRHDRAGGARGRGGRAARGRADRAHRALRAQRALLAPLRRADRALDLAAVVHAHGRARGGGARAGPRRAHPDQARGPAAALRELAGEHPAVVHLPPAVVGPPDPRLLPRGRRALRGRRAARGRGLGARPGRARHVVLEPAVAVRHARLAPRHAGAARLLPDRRALHGGRHPVPVGGPDGDDGPGVHGRDPVLARQRPHGRAGARRAADVQVAGYRDRPAGVDRRR